MPESIFHTGALSSKRRTSVIDVDYLLDCVAADDLIGFCVKCGNDQYGCEPDARKYECESCGENAVYGAQELLLMGYAG